MGRFRDKLRKFANGQVPLDTEIWTQLQFVEKIAYLKGKLDAVKFKELIYLEYELLIDDGYSVKDAFTEITDELERMEISIEEFIETDTPENFSRSYRRWKTRQNKKS